MRQDVKRVEGEQGEKRLGRKAGPGLEGPRMPCMKFQLHPGDHGESLRLFK